jgi:hypothetical protein
MSAFLAVCVLLTTFGSGASELQLTLDPQDGSYAILLDGDVWFKSNVTAGLRSDGEWHDSNPGGGLDLDGPATQINGTDSVLGAFQGWTLSFSNGTLVIRWKLFSAIPGIGLPVGVPAAIVFEQTFPNGIVNSSGGRDANASDDLSTAFPAIALPASPSNLAYASWSGGSDWPMFARIGAWDASGVLPSVLGFMGSATAVFNASLATCVFAPMDNFMVSQESLRPHMILQRALVFWCDPAAQPSLSCVCRLLSVRV